MVSDDHQGSTTQEKSSALKKMTCSLLVSVFDWQLLGYGKNHTTDEMSYFIRLIVHVLIILYCFNSHWKPYF